MIFVTPNPGGFVFRVHVTATAFFVDGDFFLRRHRKTFGPGRSPEQTAKDLFGRCLGHMDERSGARLEGEWIVAEPAPARA
jgi:hypothetical protein